MDNVAKIVNKELANEDELYTKRNPSRVNDAIYEQIFKNALNVYKASLGLGEWLGDIFQAKAIFNLFRGKISGEKAKQLQAEAVAKFRGYEDKKKLEHTLYTPERIYAQLIVEYGIENKIEI